MEPRLRLNIDQLLKQKNLRASDLSKLTGIPKQTISEWRSGLVPKSVVALKRVASAFGVSLDELIFHSHTDGSASPFRPTKSLEPESVEPMRTSVETEPYWFSCDAQGYLRSISPGLLRELDYGITLLLERPLSEFIAIEDWPQVQTAIHQAGSHNFSFRMLGRDSRTISMQCQAISLPSYKATLILNQQSQSSQEILDTIQACPSQELLQAVLQTFQQESWQPQLHFHLSYEGVSLPWLQTRRQNLARSLLALLHNLAGLAADQVHQHASSCEIKVENFGDFLQIRVKSPCPQVPQQVLDVPRAFASDSGLRWDLQAQADDYPHIVIEIPLQNLKN